MLGVTTYRYVLFNYQDFCNSIGTYLCFFLFNKNSIVTIREGRFEPWCNWVRMCKLVKLQNTWQHLFMLLIEASKVQISQFPIITITIWKERKKKKDIEFVNLDMKEWKYMIFQISTHYCIMQLSTPLPLPLLNKQKVLLHDVT